MTKTRRTLIMGGVTLAALFLLAPHRLWYTEICRIQRRRQHFLFFAYEHRTKQYWNRRQRAVSNQRWRRIALQRVLDRGR